MIVRIGPMISDVALVDGVIKNYSFIVISCWTNVSLDGEGNLAITAQSTPFGGAPFTSDE